MALNLAGSTTHYRISYDDSLSSADGLQRANALLGVCEQDYTIMSDWFGGISLPYALPIEVHIDPGGYASAGWGPPISLKPGNGSGLDVVRYLLVAEVVEMFMLAQNKGWFASDGSNEGSAGEGLSRVLSAEFLHQVGLGANMAGFDTARLWLNSDRTDYVNGVDEHDHTPNAKSGCATLFINYLSYQLGYSIKRIISAAAPTLGGVYRNLAGGLGNPFPAFKTQLDSAFPRFDSAGHPIVSTIPGPNPDNPYPLNLLTENPFMTIRIFWRMNPGRNVVNLNWAALSADSAVAIQASEYVAGSQQLPDGTEQRFIGAASITVDNITPHGPPYDTNRGVTFVVNVAWSSQLNICTDITLLSSAPQQVIWIGPRTVNGGTASGVNTPSSGASAGPDQISSQSDAGPVTYHTATVDSSQNMDMSSPPTVSTSLETA
ncbi:hypothetical protein [Spirosoma spitsbergense]|uniref:hypothetical protein n=1 Tax=Spirosoma spitsbergense TaxID=431554 RepID=UPI00036358EF|nr:hypothetical protein [Spirosoma spitsbergense]